MARPTTVVFDLGGVLIDWNPRHLYRKLFASETEMERFLAEVCTGEWNLEQDRGRPFAEAAALLVARHPDQQPMIEAFYGRWSEMLNGPIQGTVAILEELDAAGVPLYALTNWSAETWAHAQSRFSFLERFRGILVSGQVRLIKPDPAIFRLLCSQFGIVPEQSVFIDDSLKNVEAAARLGFHAHHFRSPGPLRGWLAERGLLRAEAPAG
jgi:2-haloacid dehalogenase